MNRTRLLQRGCAGMAAALAFGGPALAAQERGRAVDVAAEQFRRITESRDTLPDGARAQWLYAVFDTAARGAWRAQPQDTVLDAAGELAIYRRARPDWDWGDLARWESALAALQSIDESRLNARDALSHEIMRSELGRRISLARAPQLYMPLTNRAGPHHAIWLYGSEWIPAQTVADYEIILAHLNGVSLEIDEMIEAMRQAHSRGVVPSRAVMTDVEEALRAVVVADPDESGYLAKFSDFPASVPAADQQRLRASARRIYATKIRPAYERLLAYATDTYIPSATEWAGLAVLPGGAERYALIVQLRAGQPGLSSARLHQMALHEVVRATAAIDSFRVAIGHDGSYRDFLKFMRTDSSFQFADSASYVRAARDIAKRIDANIFRVFRTVPRLPYGIEGVRATGGGDYVGGSLADGRPGMVRLYVWSDRPGPTWRLPGLVIHEGVGHHFSQALALEQDLPRFRQLGNSTFAEGWGMYVEDMGTVLGVYDEKYAAFGYLSGMLWRAIRAVLDTGVHGLGWTWEQGMEYARETSAHEEAQIRSELVGIFTNPGFVLSYKIGHWKFLELRAFAERELGSSFDVRAFNDALVENGEMPLDVLDRHMRAWVARQKPSGR